MPQLLSTRRARPATGARSSIAQINGTQRVFLIQYRTPPPPSASRTSGTIDLPDSRRRDGRLKGKQLGVVVAFGAQGRTRFIRLDTSQSADRAVPESEPIRIGHTSNSRDLNAIRSLLAHAVCQSAPAQERLRGERDP